MNIFGEPISVIKYSFRSFYFIFIILLPVSLNSYFMSFKRSCSSLMVDCWKIGILRIPIGYRRYPISSFPLPSQRDGSSLAQRDGRTGVRRFDRKRLRSLGSQRGYAIEPSYPKGERVGAPRTTIWEKYLVFPSKTFGSGSEAS